MFRLATTALLVSGLSAATGRSTFELRGEISPHRVASVSLHAVASPFAVSTLAGADGRFRFKDVQPGTYTLSVSTQLGGDVRRTVEIGPGAADRKRRVTAEINTDGENVNRDGAGTVSARAWQIPDRAQREYEDALRKVSKRDFDGALVSLHRAVEIAPRFAAAWNHLGTMAYQRQQYREAENCFRRGLESDPDAYEPLVNLGGVLINLQSFEEALKYNTEAVRRRPQDALAQSQLGMTYAFLNQLDAAEKHLLLSLRLDPDHFSHPQLLLAEVYVRKNEPQRAADQLSDFLRGHPDWPTATKMRATIVEWRSGSGQISDGRAADERK
ncbi:MAG: tetratricopeptide repeat protein [Bryobacteraceae bacterium]